MDNSQPPPPEGTGTQSGISKGKQPGWLARVLKRLVTKPSEDGIPLQEFPGLLAKEGHTGACGLLFLVFWVISALIGFPQLWKAGAFLFIAGAIAALFFLLCWISFFLSNYFVGKIGELGFVPPTSEAPARLELNVRRSVALLSAAYVVVCAVLIWLTGGAASPFTPFYVMIFTLTIERSKVPFPGFYVLGYFLMMVVIACAAAELWATPIDSATMASIQKTGFQTSMLGMFIIFSLIVPTASAYFVARKAEKV